MVRRLHGWLRHNGRYARRGDIRPERGWYRDRGWDEWRIVAAGGWALCVAAVKPMDLGMAVVELTALGTQWRRHIPRAEVGHLWWSERHWLDDRRHKWDQDASMTRWGGGEGRARARDSPKRPLEGGGGGTHRNEKGAKRERRRDTR